MAAAEGLGPAGPRSTTVEVLRSGGEVGRDLLAVDWAATPLGPPESWPQSLTTVVNVVLGSRFSMWMAWGPQLTFVCNDAYRRDTLGSKYPWALGRPASEVWAEIWPDIGPRIDRVMRTGEATWDEGLRLFLERSGYREETYHTFSYSPLAGDDGQVAGMLCVVSEVTERVIAERRLAILRALGSEVAAVRTQHELLDAVRRSLAEGRESLPFSLVYLTDETGRASLACAVGVPDDHPGVPEEIAPGELPQEWALAGATQALVAPLQQQGGGEPYGFLVAGLNPHRPLDAGYREFVDLLAGQLAAALASAHAYEAERERAEQLAELDRAKTQFFTNVSHELRTPLTLLIGPVADALADEQTPLAPPHRARLEIVERNADRLLKLVNTLLDFSRLEAGRADAAFEPVELASYTAELASMFASAVERAGLVLEVDAPPLPEPVHVDREMWAKVVLNLLSNAMKFTREGTVAVRVRPDGEAVVVEVADTGIGIDAADLPRLFDRFHRAGGAQARSHEGSGIGLALVAELVELHGGQVGVDSAVGRGTTFTVRVPVGVTHLDPERVVSPGDAASTGAAARHADGFVAEALRWLREDDAPATAAAPGDRPRVLVVDDNGDMRRYVADLLAGAYEVRTAGDGAEALELARADPPDLVLTDVMMPRLDGLGLLAALREDPATLHIPVVMLSARAGEEGTVEGLEAGADDYLVKPFSARELLARVRSNLELDRVRRAHDELVRNQRLLDEAERLARVGSWEIDLATGALTGSAEYLRILGLRPCDIEHLGVDAAIERVVHPDDRERVGGLVAAASSGEPDVAFDLRVVLPDGTIRIAQANAELVRDEDGEPLRLRGSLQDVTEQREAQRLLADAAGEREAAAREHRIAVQLQRSLLPPLRFDPEGLDVAVFYRAGVEGTEVGGDWYDVIDLREGRTALVIGDVMGRGVRAAAVMGQLRAAVRAYSRLDLSPAEVLRSLDGVVGDLDTDQIVTCVYAIYDAADGGLVYANAGHLPPLVADPDGTTRTLDGVGGPPLGSGVGELREARVALEPGARLALYTDGLVERRDRDLVTGIRALATTLGASDGGGVDGIPERLVEAVMPGGPDDDIAVLVAEVARGPRERPVRRQLAVRATPQALAGLRAEISAFLHAVDAPERSLFDVTLAVSEAANNALVHAFRDRQEPGTLTVVLEADGTEIRAEVTDDGDGLTPRPDSPGAGLGLPVMAELADQLDVGPGPGGAGTTVRMTFSR